MIGSKNIECEVRIYCPTCIDVIPDFWHGSPQEWIKALIKLKRCKKGKEPGWCLDIEAHMIEHNYDKNHEVYLVLPNGKKQKWFEKR